MHRCHQSRVTLSPSQAQVITGKTQDNVKKIQESPRTSTTLLLSSLFAPLQKEQKPFQSPTVKATQKQVATLLAPGCTEWRDLVFEQRASSVEVGTHILLLDSNLQQLHHCEVIQPFSGDIVHMLRFKGCHKESFDWKQVPNPRSLFTWTAKSDDTSVEDETPRPITQKHNASRL